MGEVVGSGKRGEEKAGANVRYQIHPFYAGCILVSFDSYEKVRLVGKNPICMLTRPLF